MVLLPVSDAIKSVDVEELIQLCSFPFFLFASLPCLHAYGRLSVMTAELIDYMTRINIRTLDSFASRVEFHDVTMCIVIYRCSIEIFAILCYVRDRVYNVAWRAHYLHNQFKFSFYYKDIRSLIVLSCS